jgi:uncharacterized protein (TIGR02246 family)
MRRAPILANTLALVLLALAGPALPGAGLTAAAESAAPSGCAQEAEAAVKALLATQSAAWNRGDLEAFTAVYAEDASFLSPTGLTHGRQQVLARYRKRYPDKKAMGTLTLEVQEVRAFAGAPGTGKACHAAGAAVAARWQLTYPDQPDKKTAEGLTLLVLQPHGESWEIVEDASM